jgi:eukaryotic-like serine/threonine-protein kinase
MQISEDPGPGLRLGRYELLRLIGEGGMAQVWATRMDGSRGFHKVVALKTLIPALARDPQFQRMFLDEANLASKIHHRNVVEIFDLGDTNGVLFLVMELIDGQSMQRLLRPGRRPQPLAPGVAARIVADAAHGLHAAHELLDERGTPLGIVHRDVCPQNILIDRDGTVKVADFGIVKAYERLGDSTQTGEIKGKGEYMSPEQAQSQAVDRRSDIFSLGVVLFESITGALPFQVLHDLMLPEPQTAPSEPPRPTLLAPGCPHELEQIVMTALARDPEQRFQTADEMASQLEQFLVRHSGAITSAHVAEVLLARCGDKMDELRQSIASAVPPRRSRWLPRPGALLPMAGSQPLRGTPTASDVSAGLSDALLGDRGDAARPMAVPWLVAAVATGVATALFLFVVLTRRAVPLPDRTARTAVVIAPASAPSAPVDSRPTVLLQGPPILVQITPRNAVLRLDGAVIGVGDQKIARPPPGVSLSLEARADGHAAKTVALTSDSPARIELTLEREGDR